MLAAFTAGSISAGVPLSSSARWSGFLLSAFPSLSCPTCYIRAAHRRGLISPTYIHCDRCRLPPAFYTWNSVSLASAASIKLPARPTSTTTASTRKKGRRSQSHNCPVHAVIKLRGISIDADLCRHSYHIAPPWITLMQFNWCRHVIRYHRPYRVHRILSKFITVPSIQTPLSKWKRSDLSEDLWKQNQNRDLKKNNHLTQPKTLFKAYLFDVSISMRPSSEEAGTPLFRVLRTIYLSRSTWRVGQGNFSMKSS